MKRYKNIRTTDTLECQSHHYYYLKLIVHNGSINLYKKNLKVLKTKESAQMGTKDLSYYLICSK